MDELARIQQMLHVPKDQKNEFGGFSYRSCEDIIQAAKPVLKEMGQSLVMSDEIVLIGDRIYVKATVTLHPCGAHAIAYAREADAKKGMDPAQVTGAASSYARKYALAGLFAIDNNRDPDTNENTQMRNEVQKIYEDDLIQAIKECESLEDLKDLWGNLSEEERGIARPHFTKQKEALRAAANT